MEAIVRAGGRQLRLKEGQEFEINRVEGQPGDVITLPVLALIDETGAQVGTPEVPGAAVRARITAHGRAPKLLFMKYKNKVRYRRKIGHKQPISRLVVEAIERG